MSKEYQHEYYENNKTRILETMNQEIECDVCKCKVKKCRLNRHKKTKKCQLANHKEQVGDIQQLKKQIDELKELILNQNKL